MAWMNRVTLIGYLGAIPDARVTPQGRAVTKFALATTERWTTKSGEQGSRTDWHNIVLWGRQAEIAREYLKKGDCCLVEGKIRYDSWEDNGGARHYRTDIVVDRFQILPGKNVVSTTPASQNIAEVTVEEPVTLPVEAEELPF